LALTVVLYSCSLVNFDAFIADYNVAHSREISGKGMPIDTRYLAQLGPQALPAIERMMQIRTDSALVGCHDRLIETQRLDMAWRAWGFRSWRLQRRLEAEARGQASSQPAG